MNLSALFQVSASRVTFLKPSNPNRIVPRAVSHYHIDPKSNIRVLLSAIGVLLCSLLSVNAAAQGPPDMFADIHNPAGPQGPTGSSNIWHVDPITGALSVKVAIPTLPKGGRGPKVPFVLEYNSSSTIVFGFSFMNVIANGGPGNYSPNCVDSAGSNDCFYFPPTEVPANPFTSVTAFYSWVGAGAGGGSFGPIGPWTRSGPYVYNSSATLQTDSFQTNVDTISSGPGCTIGGPYIYIDENGSSHDLNLGSVSPPSGSPPSMPPV